MKFTDQRNADENLLVQAVEEAADRCATLLARTVYTIKKLKRVEAARLAQIGVDRSGKVVDRRPQTEGPRFKSESGQRFEFDVTLLDRHRAEHYFLSAPFGIQMDEVETILEELGC